mmetsp:Transcript_2865/g.8722  ORF Transcript_2865/g.8722 Transcript_2865/m.8722 type:complete len:283 (+) Transcript_2865:231-1079(+)
MTPTLFTGSSTANACAVFPYRSARRSSSRKMASAFRSLARRSSVIAPRTLMASPGPGNGWRQTDSGGTPSCRPIERTSSLNSSRRGSISSSFITSLMPPTLWCVLMVAEGPLYDTLSITSGYSVPCSRKVGEGSSLDAKSSNTSMNVWPMILRLRSGSSTPLSAVRNRSRASTRTRLMPRCDLRRSTTSSDSSMRSSPLSTSTAWKRSPMARVMSTLATVESTPPLTAPTTCPSGPTCSWMARIASATTLPMVQSVEQPQMPTTKLRKMAVPLGVCVTSGWN